MVYIETARSREGVGGQGAGVEGRGQGACIIPFKHKISPIENMACVCTIFRPLYTKRLDDTKAMSYITLNKEMKENVHLVSWTKLKSVVPK